MSAPQRDLSIGTPTVREAEADRASGPRPKRPSRLGLGLAACLLLGLLLWRHAFPDATPWLDLAALTAAWAFLLAVRACLRRKGAPRN
jgi:hypothetical protein